MPQNTGNKKKSVLNINDAMKLASMNPVFAKDLIVNPETYKPHFNLKKPEIDALKNVIDRVPGAAPGLPGGLPGGAAAWYEG